MAIIRQAWQVFVLVHGTGHGGWCWRFIVPLLRAEGYDVYTPTLTGLGASSHLLHELDRISLDVHVKDITNMLFYDDYQMLCLLVTVMEEWCQ
jgi:pimeloyl-ACP methyl ester carboxylesterase